MSISPDLFDSIVPAEMWVTFGPVEPAYSDERTITVRIKPMGRRSVTVKQSVSRYSPESSIFKALANFVDVCHAAQRSITRTELQQILDDAIVSYVEPF